MAAVVVADDTPTVDRRFFASATRPVAEERPVADETVLGVALCVGACGGACVAFAEDVEPATRGFRAAAAVPEGGCGVVAPAGRTVLDVAVEVVPGAVEVRRAAPLDPNRFFSSSDADVLDRWVADDEAVVGRGAAPDGVLVAARVGGLVKLLAVALRDVPVVVAAGFAGAALARPVRRAVVDAGTPTLDGRLVTAASLAAASLVGVLGGAVDVGDTASLDDASGEAGKTGETGEAVDDSVTERAGSATGAATSSCWAMSSPSVSAMET